MQSLAELLWLRLPRVVAARLPLIGEMLGDGGWLRAWAPLAVAAPALALALGLVIGLGHAPSAEIFADSIPLFAALTAVSLLGAGLGAAAWLGYVMGDLLYGGHLWVQPNVLDHLVRERSGQLVVFLVLWIGVVALPYGITRLSRQTVATLPRRLRGVVTEAVARAAVGALVIAAWIAVLPFAVMPFYLWRGYGGPAPTIVALRQGWLLFVAIAVVVGVVRVVLERAAQRRAPAIPIEWSVAVPPSRNRTWLGIVAGAVVGTLLLAGMIQGWLDTGVVLGGLLVAGIIRAFVMPRLVGFVQLVDRIPVVVRIVVVAAVGYGLTMVALTSQQGVIVGDSYLGLLVAIVGATVVAAIVLPGAPAIPADEVAPPVPGALPEPLKALGVPVLMALLGAMLFPEIARADDCSGAFDCFQTMSAGALAAAAAGGAGGVLYALYGKGGALNRERQRLAAERADRDAKRSEGTARPSEPAPRPNHSTIKHGDGSREELIRDKAGKVFWYHFGPPYTEHVGDRTIDHPEGEVERRVEVMPDKSSTTYGPNGEIVQKEQANRDGTTYRLTPDGTGGGSIEMYDAEGNLKASGRYAPDMSSTLTEDTPGGQKTTNYGPGGQPTGTSTTTVTGDDTRTDYWDYPPR